MELEYEVDVDPLDKDATNDQNIEVQNQLEQLTTLIADLESELTNTPPNQRNSSVYEEARDLIEYYRNPAGEVDEFTTTELKENIILRSEEVMDEIHDSSDFITHTPY